MNPVVRCWIKNLEHMREDAKDVSILGIIVGKSEPKIFENMDGDERGVLTLTIRDSPYDTINCVFWGSKEFIMTTSDNYKYGVVVNIMEAKVSSPSERSNYQPKTSSRFLLTINEGKGRIYLHTGPQDNFRKLLNLPLKPLGLTLSLTDVNARGELASGDFVDLLVVVRMIRPLREIKTRHGRITHCREIVVMDKSFPGMLLTFWGKTCDDRINSWKPMETCLILYDIKSDYSSFYRAVTLNFTSRTLITENIQVSEAKELIAYAATVPPLEKFSFESTDLPIPEEIRTVMTVQQILDRAEGHLISNEEQFTALVYAVITKFDLDGFGRIVTERCSFCKRITDGDCSDTNCVNLQFQTSQKNSLTFEILMDLTDHTGTSTNCRLMRDAAEKLIGMSPEEFLKLSPQQKTNLKWKTLLERCAVKVVVRKKSVYRPRMWIGIVECVLADHDDVAKNIKVF
uniref:MEIOB-like N-terminal domain-containing protein n=1 Tax=Phlebotomus papatasi TaxID=29031 RepID=A0A1B0D4X2_PHLPP